MQHSVPDAAERMQKMKPSVTRNRPVYALLAVLTIGVGLASRHFSFLLPLWLAKNAGDMLYAVMAYWLLGVCFPRLPPARTALTTGLFCFAIEFLKFSNASWLVAARHNHFGALVFGSGFHWSNLVCYVIGVLVALALEVLPKSKKRPPSPQ